MLAGSRFHPGDQADGCLHGAVTMLHEQECENKEGFVSIEEDECSHGVFNCWNSRTISV